MDYSSHLKPLGLNDKESLVYTTALSMGIFSASEISARTGVKRPTCYVVLEELMSKGLMTVVHQAKKLLYKAESPENILMQARRNLALAEKILPSLLGLNAQSKNAPVIKFYSGRKGVQNIFDDSIKNFTGTKEHYVIGSAQHLIDMTGEDFVQEFVKRRVEAGVKVYGIRIKEKENHNPLFSPNKMLRETRYSPPGMEIPSTVFIYKNKVAMLSTEDIFGFIVESKEFAQTMLVLFKSLWEISTPA